jgi:hypothetical protein
MCLTITIMSIIHILFKTQRFGEWIMFSSLGGMYSARPNRKSWSLSLKRCVLNKRQDDG